MKSTTAWSTAELYTNCLFCLATARVGSCNSEFQQRELIINEYLQPASV